ncbi:MAG: NAD(P)/FAD-dependent oxidoreductase [Desulfobacterota bacterium]|nr:NAD(P)/FAD-dependent oxidoreductase [Thermodesulfobacteriota bacterium]
MSLYDLAIVGAGPGGLHTAKWAAKKGLKVALIEKRKDISKMTRYCSEHIILDENYNGDTIIVEPGKPLNEKGWIDEDSVNKIRSSRWGWELTYKGALCPVRDKYYYSRNLKHHAHYAWPDRRPFAWKYDKAGLLQQILDEVLPLGVDYINETTCYQAIDNPSKVLLKCVSHGKRFTLEAKKLVAADGASAQVAQSLGMNEDRVYFASALTLAVYMSGVKDYSPEQWCGYWGLCYGSNFAPLMGTGPAGHFEWADVILIGHPKQMPWDLYEFFTKKSPVAYMFENAKIEQCHSCMTKAFSPMKKPYKGNVLAIGDAAAFVEVQAQGALNCGFWAAEAVAKELDGKPGFEEYTEKWLKTFEFNDDGMMQVTTGYALIPYYTDEQVEYLFSLLDGVTMDGSWSQYQSPRMMWREIHKHDERIKKERPDIWEKIVKQQARTLSDSMSQ